MNIKRSQHYNYTHETIPMVWHKNADDFIKYLDKDGTIFLRFWWKHLEENLGVKILSSSEGLGYQIKEARTKNNDPVRVVLLTLPAPQANGEVFYMALVKYPDRHNFLARFFLMKLPVTRLLSLELEGTSETGEILTGIYELTPRARNIRVHSGCQPLIGDFYKTILTDLKLKG